MNASISKIKTKNLIKNRQRLVSFDEAMKRLAKQTPELLLDGPLAKLKNNLERLDLLNRIDFLQSVAHQQYKEIQKLNRILKDSHDLIKKGIFIV